MKINFLLPKKISSNLIQDLLSPNTHSQSTAIFSLISIAINNELLQSDISPSVLQSLLSILSENYYSLEIRIQILHFFYEISRSSTISNLISDLKIHEVLFEFLDKKELSYSENHIFPIIDNLGRYNFETHVFLRTRKFSERLIEAINRAETPFFVSVYLLSLASFFSSIFYKPLDEEISDFVDIAISIIMNPNGIFDFQFIQPSIFILGRSFRFPGKHICKIECSMVSSIIFCFLDPQNEALIDTCSYFLMNAVYSSEEICEQIVSLGFFFILGNNFTDSSLHFERTYFSNLIGVTKNLLIGKSQVIFEASQDEKFCLFLNRIFEYGNNESRRIALDIVVMTIECFELSEVSGYVSKIFFFQTFADQMRVNDDDFAFLGMIVLCTVLQSSSRSSGLDEGFCELFYDLSNREVVFKMLNSSNKFNQQKAEQIIAYINHQILE